MSGLHTILGKDWQNGQYPFFWQHGESHAVLEDYMEKISASGMKGVCIEARPHPEFVQQGWWSDLDCILAKAKELDMKLWILDDSHFPTGFANGRIKADYPQYLKWYAMFAASDTWSLTMKSVWLFITYTLVFSVFSTLLNAAETPYIVRAFKTPMENLEHSTFVEPSGTAVDHYNKYKEDIALLASVGCNAYRFSVEWARLEPEEGVYDEKELEHYRDVLDCCAENHITPIVTLHHFSSPAWLIGKGGWGDPYVEDAFARYAEYVVSGLKRKLPYVCTINEANMGFQLQKVIEDMMKSRQREGGVQVGVNMDMSAIMVGLEEQAQAFGCDMEHINTFLAARSQEQELFVMRAHRKAYQAIKNSSPDTKVGLTLSLFDYQPEADGQEAAAKLWQEDFGFYLPYIKEDDFLGVQNYSRKIVTSAGAQEPAQGAPLTQMGYEDYPASIGHVLRKVAKRF